MKGGRSDPAAFFMPAPKIETPICKRLQPGLAGRSVYGYRHLTLFPDGN
jgi:hypothetical protein